MATSGHQTATTYDGRDANAVYALGSNTAETARLQRQADELAADSAALLDRVGLRPGHSAIDLGCGPRGILELLASRVSPGGRVIGLDADLAHTAMAAELAAARGLAGVQVIQGDARRSGLPSGSFDLVHARTLLVTVPEPAQVVAEMVRLAKPGGWVAALEADTEHALCYPPHPAFDRICEIHPVVFARNGADPIVGRRVPELFRQAGLADVDVEIRAASYPPGSTRRTIRLDLVRSMRPKIVELGLASEEELDALDAAARAHIGDPRTVVMSALTFLIWGRKPAGLGTSPRPRAAHGEKEAAMATSTDPSPGSYAITGGVQGKQRLNLLAEIMQPTTLRLLRQAGLRSGDRCLDLGCGGGDVVLDIARISGPDGFVTGVDFDPQVVALARQDARDAGAGNVEYHVADVRVFEGGPFDLIYARFLLSHLSEPATMLTRMRQLAYPGGRIVVEDTDMSGCYCHPRDPANTRFAELYTEVVRRGGGDADLGRRLPALALAAGLGDVHWNVFQPVHVSGPHKHMTALTMERIRAAVLRHGLATDQEIDTIIDGMHAFAQDPATLVGMPRIVQVQGTA